MLEAPVQDYTFMIRKDLFDAAGVDVPAIEKDWTWDDLYDALVKVKAYMVSEGMIKESDYVWSDLWCGSEVTDGSGGNLLKLMASAYDVQAGWLTWMRTLVPVTMRHICVCFQEEKRQITFLRTPDLRMVL